MVQTRNLAKASRMMPEWFILMMSKVVVTLVLPFVLVFAFLDELQRGLISAVCYAWAEVLIEWEAYLKAMKRETID